MVFGLMPLVVGIPYAVAWILRPTQFLNVTIGYPYAGVKEEKVSGTVFMFWAFLEADSTLYLEFLDHQFRPALFAKNKETVPDTVSSSDSNIPNGFGKFFSMT
jgi:hypothetical protein